MTVQEYDAQLTIAKLFVEKALEELIESDLLRGADPSVRAEQLIHYLHGRLNLDDALVERFVGHPVLFRAMQ